MHPRQKLTYVMSCMSNIDITIYIYINITIYNNIYIYIYIYIYILALLLISDRDKTQTSIKNWRECRRKTNCVKHNSLSSEHNSYICYTGN